MATSIGPSVETNEQSQFKQNLAIQAIINYLNGQLRSLTVSTLPTVGQQGRRYLVTDATSSTFASIVAGVGSVKVPVYDDGTNWRIG